ncbi:MAG: hypothetical protein ACKVHL_09225 [Rhodospirillales bacterium]
MTISRVAVKSRSEKQQAFLSAWLWPSVSAATVFVLLESVSKTNFF